TQLLAQYPQALIVHNKADLAPRLTERPEGIQTSAVSGARLSELEQGIVSRLIPKAPNPGEPLAFTQRQTGLLRRAAEALVTKRFADAMLALEQIDPSIGQ